MVRSCCKVWPTTAGAVCVLLVVATAGNAQIRGKPAGTPSMKAAPAKERAKKGADQPAEAKSANGSRGTQQDDPLADDDSPKAKSGSSVKKDGVKKKSDRKGTKDGEPTAKNPSGRP